MHKTPYNQDSNLLTQAEAEQIASDLMTTKAALDAKAVSISTHWVVVYQGLAGDRFSVELIDSTWDWNHMRTPAQSIKIGLVKYTFRYMPQAKEVIVQESIPWIYDEKKNSHPPIRIRTMPAATTMPDTETILAWIRTAFSPPIHSSVFPDYMSHYCPVRKRAWLYLVDDFCPIVAEKDMEQAPTEQQVTNWVVDHLNGRLNEELAKLAKKG